jgi:protein-disulfide isomerase
MKPMPPLEPEDHARGPADAPLLVVQYGDYDCPHTRVSGAVLRRLEGELGLPLRFVFRHFPLPHLHANAQFLSEIAEAAGSLGHFWEVHDRLMARRRGIEREDAFADAQASGIDVETLRPLLGSPAIEARIERDVKGGASAGVHSTPTWFFNGVVWDGHYDLATLAERARAALATR